MRTRALKVLLLEDNAGDARLLREMFTTERPGSIELTHLMRMSDALAHLAKGGVDIVLLDGTAGWTWTGYRATSSSGGTRCSAGCADGIGR